MCGFENRKALAVGLCCTVHNNYNVSPSRTKCDSLHLLSILSVNVVWISLVYSDKGSIRNDKLSIKPLVYKSCRLRSAFQPVPLPLSHMIASLQIVGVFH